MICPFKDLLSSLDCLTICSCNSAGILTVSTTFLFSMILLYTILTLLQYDIIMVISWLHSGYNIEAVRMGYHG